MKVNGKMIRSTDMEFKQDLMMKNMKVSGNKEKRLVKGNYTIVMVNIIKDNYIWD